MLLGFELPSGSSRGGWWEGLLTNFIRRTGENIRNRTVKVKGVVEKQKNRAWEEFCGRIDNTIDLIESDKENLRWHGDCHRMNDSRWHKRMLGAAGETWQTQDSLEDDNPVRENLR